MTVNKGLKSLAGSTPNFSNQALEEAINTLKIGWVTKGFQLDSAIANNTVLTTSQKNDVKDTINNIAYLNVGRYLGDMVRHTNTQLDGTIVFLANPDVEDTADFLEILQTVSSLQTLIPNLFGETAAEKNRDINDHLGILNNMFTQTEDSSLPVFTSLKESIVFITNANLANETALETAYDNLRNFLAEIRDDSTDFQQTLNTFASAVATAHTNFDSTLQGHPYSVKRTQMITDRDKIVTQLTLETNNCSGIRTYVESLSNTLGYIGLAEDTKMKDLLVNISQNENWRNYFSDYETNRNNLNPIYTTKSDSDKAGIIEQVLTARGLPDVADFLNLEAVVDKAKRDDRIDTSDFDNFSNEQLITKCCEQLSIRTSGSVFQQSKLLLDNLNAQDRAIVSAELDLNESSDTIS